MTLVEKVSFAGGVTSIQPRIRLLRSFDERTHTYLGYVVRVREGTRGRDEDLLVAIGAGAQEEHRLRVGDRIAGVGVPVEHPALEIAHLYKVSALRVLERGSDRLRPAPPWLGVPPELPVYRERGCRRLDARTYEEKCARCIWGCRMPVEMIIDQWNPDVRQYRTETFCYGPLSCPSYRAGAKRRVPGRRGMVWIEDDWVDQEEVGHRSPND